MMKIPYKVILNIIDVVADVITAIAEVLRERRKKNG